MKVDAKALAVGRKAVDQAGLHWRHHCWNLNLPESVAEFSGAADRNAGGRDGDRAANKLCCLDHDRLCNREGRAVFRVRELGQ